MIDNPEVFNKIADSVEKDAREAYQQLWKEYCKLYRDLEDRLEDSNLSKMEKRRLTKMFDDIVWSENRDTLNF